MKLSSISQNLKTKWNDSVKYLQTKGEKIGSSVKSAYESSIKYTKNLTNDTVTFVKAHPKQTGAAFAAGAVLVAAGSAVKNAVEKAQQKKFVLSMIQAQNDVEKQKLKSVVHRQAGIIKTLKESNIAKTECLDASHDAITALKKEKSVLKAKINS